MKIRSDFVTNSSSSSFIISTTADIPHGYEHVVRKLTQETLLDVMKEMPEYDWTRISYDLEDAEIQTIGKFTDEQMTLLRLLTCGRLDQYIRILDILAKSDTPIYHILVDRDWLYNQSALDDFINSGKVIESETDL